jgi:hypothetical protein
MPSIAVQATRSAITAADAFGNLTVASNANLYPGAKATVWTADGNTATVARVKILAVVGSTGVVVRRYPNIQDRIPGGGLSPSSGLTYDHDEVINVNYGYSNMLTWNGSSYISMEAQSVPIDPAYSKRTVP